MRPEASGLLEQAERGVIGAILRDNRRVWSVGQLGADDFVDPLRARIFGAIVEHVRGGAAIDLMSAEAVVEGQADLAEVAHCVHTVSGPAMAPEFARIVREARARRDMRAAAADAIDAIDENQAPAAVASELVARVSRSMVNGRADVTLAECAERARAHRGRSPDALSTTIPTLDGYLGGGFQRGRMYVLGGRPGAYKSVLALQAMLAAAKRGHPVGMLSLEMPEEEIGERAAKAGVDGDLPARFDCSSFTLDAIAARIAEWSERYKIRLAVVDHVQLVADDGSGKKRFEQLSDVSRRMKTLAKEFRISTLVLSQISREVEKERRYPRPSDLRECGNLEQDADAIIFLHRSDGKGGPETDEHVALVAKNRSGLARAKPIPLRVDGPRFSVWEQA